MQYSISKGFKKGLLTAMTVGASFIAFAGFSDVSIWGLIVTYIQPIVGSMTVGGLITIVLNFVKVKTSK